MFDDMNSDDMMQFDLPKNQSSVIKVLGVGGGGSNAVNHMYQQGIRGVDFVICNTDRQALENSPIPNKVQLGSSLTEGLGAGARPEIGREAAMESAEEVKKLLNTNTKMLFITAGMGGGTGTGAAPVIAKTAKELDILVVAIVTIPFEFEGKQRMDQAQKGIEDLRPIVDSLIVINNNKLRQIYGNLGYKSGFNKADEVLASAAKGIAEVITHHYTLNIDLRDARTVLSNSGTAIMGKAIARGESRAHQAISEAIDSPLLNDNKITGCKNVLLLLVSGEEEITIDEIGEINDYIQHEAGGNANIIMGIGEDPELGDAVSVTVIATGFSRDYQVHDIEVMPKRVVHVLDAEQAPSLEFPTHSMRTEADARRDFEHEEPLEFAMPQTPTEPEPSTTPPTFDLFEKPLNPSADNHSPSETHPPLDPEFEAPISAGTSQAEDSADTAFGHQDYQTSAESIQTTSGDAMADADIRPIDEESELEASDKPAYTYFSLDDEESLSVDLTQETDTDSSQEENQQLHGHGPDENLLNSAIEASVPSDEEFTLFTRPNAEIPRSQADASHSEPARGPEQHSEGRVDQRQPEESSMSHTLYERKRKQAEERKMRLTQYQHKFRNNPNAVDAMHDVPAYKRLGVELDDTPASSEEPKTHFTLFDEEEGVQLKTKNKFLHDNVD